MNSTVRLISRPEQVQALAHPLRQAVIDRLREPDTAAGVARVLGRPRQQINYHLKELARCGLVEPAGERRKGNFIEQLYRTVARRFLISSRFAWDQDRLAALLRDRIALAQLADLGEQIQQDAAALIDAAMHEGTDAASATVVAEVRFDDEAARAGFLADYTDALRALLKKHGSKTGTPFRVALAAYPEQEDE